MIVLPHQITPKRHLLEWICNYTVNRYYHSNNALFGDKPPMFNVFLRNFAMRFLYILITLVAIGGAAWFFLNLDAEENSAEQALIETPLANQNENSASGNNTKPTQTSNQVSPNTTQESNTQNRSHPQISTDIYDRYAALNQNPDFPTLVDRLNAMSSRKNGKQYNTTEVMAALEQDHAWEDVYAASETLPLSEIQKNDGRKFIKLNPLKIETLMPGDTLALPVTQLNQRFDMVVDRVEQNEEGTLTLYGHLSGQTDNAIVIGQSDKYTHAEISTPTGPYEMKVFGEAGWIAPAP
jgi:hypothetical protein